MQNKGITRGVIFLLILSLLTVGGVENVTRCEAKTTRQQAICLYRNMLQKENILLQIQGSKYKTTYKRDDQITFSLVDVDRDGVPELYVRHTDMQLGLAVTEIIYYVSHGRVYGLTTGHGGFQKYKKSNIIYDESFQMGVMEKGYYQLKNGRVVTLAGSAVVEMGPGKDSYHIGKKKVSKKKYKAYVKKITKKDKFDPSFVHAEEHLITDENIETYIK